MQHATSPMARPVPIFALHLTEINPKEEKTPAAFYGVRKQSRNMKQTQNAQRPNDAPTASPSPVEPSTAPSTSMLYWRACSSLTCRCRLSLRVNAFSHCMQRQFFSLEWLGLVPLEVLGILERLAALPAPVRPVRVVVFAHMVP